MVSRDELYDLVWSKPMIKAAEQFGVSGSYLARVCSALNVPRPARGYWAKLEVGKAPPRTPLPDARPGDQLDWSKDGELPRRASPQLTPPQPKPARARIPRDHVHGLIRGARSLFERSRPVDEGAYLRPYKRLLVDVTTSKACLDKALDFANVLFNTFEAAGRRVVLASAGERLGRARVDEREAPGRQRDRYERSGLWSPDRPTVVYLGSLPIGLAVVEMSESVVLRYVDGKYIRDADYVPPRRSRLYGDSTWTTTRELPSGRLRLTAYSPYGRVNWSMNWDEAKTSPLRAAVKTIVQALEKVVPDLISRVEEADRQAEIERQEWRAAEERRRREDDRRRVEESVRESNDHLGRIIQQWAGVMSVEQFLAGVDERAEALPESEKALVLDRLRLARDFLGSRDPLDFFLAWKTPAERYRPKYSDE